jgi:hypothetical protein
MTLPNRFITLLGHLTFAVLFILSIVFYKERMLFSDMAYYTFKMLLSGDFVVQHKRFVGILPQILPLLAIKAALPLKFVLLIYSISMILFNYIAFIYCWHWLKSSAYALIILFLSIGLYTDAFYWCSSELPLGVVLAAVIFAIADSRKSFAAMHRLDKILLFGLMPFSIFAHPLAMFPLIFGFIFVLVLQKAGTTNNNEPQDEKHDEPHDEKHNKYEEQFSEMRYWIGFVLVCLIALKVFAISLSPYEIESSKQAKLLLFEFLKKPFAAPVFSLVGIAFLTKYYLLPLFFTIISFFYIKNKNWLKALVFVGATLGLFTLIHLSNAKCMFGFYIENFYIVLAFCLALPVVVDWLPSLKIQPQFLLSGIALVVVLRLASITMAHDVFTERLDFLTTLLAKSKAWNGTKFAMDSKDALPQDKMLLDWGAPYETLLLSAMASPKQPATVFINSNPHSNDWAFQSQANSFVGAFEITPYKDFPKQYFQFEDEKYQFIDKNGLMK